MGWSDWQKAEGDGLEFEEILYEKKWHEELDGGVARVTINKPKKYNVMTLATVDEMFRAFYDANHDTSDRRDHRRRQSENTSESEGTSSGKSGACARPSTTATPTTA